MDEIGKLNGEWICPECESGMTLLIAKYRLHKCRGCGLEQYESGLRKYWQEAAEAMYRDTISTRAAEAANG